MIESFLEWIKAVVKVIGSDVKAFIRYCEDNHIGSVIVEVLELLGIELLTLLQIAVTPQGGMIARKTIQAI